MMATSNSRICYHSPFQLGQLLNGTYRLTSRLGVGGSTEVFGAVHVRTKDEYALKVLRHDSGLSVSQETNCPPVGHGVVVAAVPGGAVADVMSVRRRGL